MDDLQDYLKSLNPKPNEQAILIYGRQYNLWMDGKYIGIATWTQDENVGDSFQTKEMDEKHGEITVCYCADRWELIVKQQSNMIEVTQEVFYNATRSIPYKCSFILGEHGVIGYEGKGKKFQNTIFAKQGNGKYFLHRLLIDK